MAPDAPQPYYDEHGRMLLQWLLVVRYDPAKECVTLSWTKDGDLFRSSKQGAMAYPLEDTADLIEGITTTVHMLSAPGLF